MKTRPGYRYVRCYHFIFTFENVSELKELIDDMYQHQEEGLYIQATVVPACRETHWDRETNRYKPCIEPANINFELMRPLHHGDGWTFASKRGTNFDETKEDKRFGEVLPPVFYEVGWDGKRLPYFPEERWP